MKGDDLEKLRRDCFERDGYRCQIKRKGRKCLKLVTWDTGHMAHIGAKRRHGDSLGNVRTACDECHHIEHQYGKSMEKPCPPKPKDEIPGTDQS